MAGTETENALPLPAPVATELLWDTLIADPGTGVSILDSDGRIVFVNRVARQIFLEDTEVPATGKLLSELFPTPWVEERLTLLNRLRTGSGHAVLRSIWNGKQIQSTIRRVPSESGELDRFLIITRQGVTAAPESAEVIESKLVDLGPLDVLTTRELEVLALIGQGMRLKEIAKMLYRAPKTIENHRLSIGRKLGETDRMRLAEIAREAGLELSDAYLDRIHRDQGGNGRASSNGRPEGAGGA
jgi:DNA-binding CsgD family transcriptional regulator